MTKVSPVPPAQMSEDAFQKKRRMCRRWSFPALLVLLVTPTEAHTVQQEQQEQPCLVMISVEPTDTATLDWLQQAGWCDIIDVNPGATEAQVAAIRDRGFNVALQMMAHPETFNREYPRRFPGITLDDIMQRHLRAANGRPETVIWQFMMEEDSAGVAFPYSLLKQKPKTHAQAYALFNQRIAEAAAATQPYSGVRLWARAGFASSMHPFARSGAEMILIERTNDDIEDLQTGIAFSRGAARQYHRQWGVDFSQWWGAIYGIDAPHGAAYFRRNLYISYFAGAESLAIEYLGPLPKEGDTTSLAAALAEFNALRKRNPVRGTPDVPAAILLPNDHGWITPPYWRARDIAWNYARVPYRPGDRGIDGVFAAAFPASTYAMQPFPFGAYKSDNPPASPFALSCVTKEYAPSAEDEFHAPPPIPFGRFESRDAARETISTQDTAVYRPMADSRWGDIFDVLTEDASSETLAAYQVLIIAGPLNIDAAMQARLEAYVRGGGTLIWAAGVARPEHEALTGIRMEPEFRVGRAWKWDNGDYIHEPFLYLPATVTSPAATTVLAAAPNGDPLVACHKLDAGLIYTSLLPWFESENRPLSGPALRLLDHAINLVQPVEVTGLPVEWLSRSEDGDGARTVLVANHAGERWHGTVRVKKPGDAILECRELRKNTLIPFSRQEGDVQCELDVDPYDVAIIQFSSGPIYVAPQK